jgi:hypothetical protein
VKNCPFLTKPMAKRRDLGDIENKHVDGKMIERNPGVSMIWECTDYKPFRTGDGWLITVGNPINVTAWREGRHATREELFESVASGLPLLYAEAEKEGRDAIQAFLEVTREWEEKILNRWFPEKEAA